jgi:hypothetical protein
MQEVRATRPSLKTHRVSLAAKHHPNSTSFLLCSLDTPLPRYQPRYFVNFTRLTITTFPLSHIQILPRHIPDTLQPTTVIHHGALCVSQRSHEHQDQGAGCQQQAPALWYLLW